MSILKTFKTSFFLFLTSLIFLASCSKEEGVVIDDETSKAISQKQVNDKALISEFLSIQKSMINTKSTNNIKFNNELIYEVSLEGTKGSILLANQIGFDKNNSVNYGISAAITEKGLSESFIIKTSKTSDNIYKIYYLNGNFEPLTTIKLDPNSETIEVVNNEEVQTKGCGQGTADCMTDAYSNHGWISVWATVQTAFIPATAAALGAACAIENCIGDQDE